MQIRQNQQFCAQMLHAHRRLGLACWGWLLLGSLLWLLELLAAALVLRIRNTLPVSLLTEQALLWRLVQLFWLVPAWLVWNWCSWSLWRRCTAVVSMLPHRRPAGRKKQLWLALQNTLLRTLLLQTVTLCLFGAYQLGKAGAAIRKAHRICSPPCSCWCWGHFAFWGGAMSAWGCGACRSSALPVRNCRRGKYPLRQCVPCTAAERNCWHCWAGMACRCCPW